MDFSGQFVLNAMLRWIKKMYKECVALFSCFVTGTVHSELFMDASTKEFTAALQRFVARRGRPSDFQQLRYEFCWRGSRAKGLYEVCERQKPYKRLRSNVFVTSVEGGI
jgi:hypothetical protein